eukprot:TRINITY_DN34945_c0_g1_i1.p2 TRINITY_DN34945_c0_g1~~TRINITY_DN34945_c0_g1_i1.p2  ORF type:complete len:114 (+),score=38.99 TRINITY_DN34945_c0_g1_i1:92-433(+)
MACRFVLFCTALTWLSEAVTKEEMDLHIEETLELYEGCHNGCESDGKLSMEEIVQSLLENSNEKIEKRADEVRHHRRAFNKADRNANGLLERSEIWGFLQHLQSDAGPARREL